MKQQHIGFKDLIERLLPIHELPSVERLRVQRALRSDIALEVEQAAMHAIGLLESQGAIKRLPPPRESEGPVVRYQTRDQQDVITLHMPGPRRREGVRVVLRRSLPTDAQASLDHIRRLVRLDAIDLHHDSTLRELREQLDHAGRELLGSGAVLFLPTDKDASGDAAEQPLDPLLMEDALKHPGMLFYAPDTERCPALLTPARRFGARSVILTAVLDSEGKRLGVLEVHHPDADPFEPVHLALVALLAESAAVVLERNERVAKKVFIDERTQTYNSMYYGLQIARDLDRAKREDKSLALMLCDIDNFKKFNDTYGYEAGNQVLVKVASVLKAGVREYDTVARWGGEEFAVLLAPHVREEDVLMITERLREAIESAVVQLEGADGRGQSVNVTISAGVAMYPAHADNPGELFRLAEAGLKTAKRTTKNRVVFHRPPPTIIPPPSPKLDSSDERKA